MATIAGIECLHCGGSVFNVGWGVFKDEDLLCLQCGRTPKTNIISTIQHPLHRCLTNACRNAIMDNGDYCEKCKPLNAVA